MTNAKRIALLLLPAVLVAGCGASKPQPPKSLCGVKVPASAVTPLLPEGEKVTEKKSNYPSAKNSCLVYVDGTYYFKVQNDPDGKGYTPSPGVFAPTKPRKFQGKLGIGELQAQATADCADSKAVFGAISLTIAESDKLYADSRDDIEKFLNAYMPEVQKHYGCKA